MDRKKMVLQRAAVRVLLGLIGGGIAADLRWRPQTRHLGARGEGLEAERTRADELQSRLAAAERGRRDLGQPLEAERPLRHRYEDLPARGRT